MAVANLLLALALAAEPIDGDPELIVIGAHFYSQQMTRGEIRSIETNRIPYRPGESCYAWTIEVETLNQTVAIREVFELSAPAEQWNIAPDQITAVTKNQSLALTEFSESLADGVITHGWCVAEGDPLGPYRIRVFNGERLLHDFRFELVGITY